MTCCILSHSACLNHTMPEVAGDPHPENRERLDAINNQLLSSGLDFVIAQRDCSEVTREQLERAHCKDYLDALEDSAKQALGDTLIEVGEDAFISAGTLKAARYAAGAAVQGVDMVLNKDFGAVFCNVRPPGHHAERKRAMGFCFYNNIATAALHALEARGLSKVAIIDFDVHHGNGTEDILKDDPRVLFCSSFQDQLFPKQEFPGNGSTLINVPLPAVAKGPDFREAVVDHWLPALERFEPELILISAGFDGHLLDDMSQVSLTEADYGWVTDCLRQYSDSHDQCQGLVSTLEGGYELGALARSAVAHIKSLAKLS